MSAQLTDEGDRRRQRLARSAVALFVATTMLVGWSSTTAMAASKKPTAKPATKPAAKPNPSLAGFCAATKEWKAYEIAWFASGKPNDAWVLDTRRIMIKLVATAPAAIHSSMLQLGYELVTQRGHAVNFGKNPGDADSLESLLTDAGLDAGSTPSGVIAARDAVGAYAVKKCKVDVLQPFRDFAAANG